MNSHFYAMLFRMKYIDRWALMRNTRSENLSEHSLETAFIAHALCIIENKRFGGKVNAEKAAVLALFHDTPEIITGDLPTPVKYYSSEIKKAYDDMEKVAVERLLDLLPSDLRPEFEEIYNEKDEHILKIVRAADKLSALIKCRDEIRMGNREFVMAEEAALKAIKGLELPAAEVFVNEFLPSFSLSLDEQQ